MKRSISSRAKFWLGASGELVDDGRTVATSGINGELQPLISPDGAHYGVVSQDQGANSIDGRAILPANGQGILGGVTDAGHWVLVGGKPGVPLVDGVVRGPPADEAVISDDGKNIALLANSATSSSTASTSPTSRSKVRGWKLPEPRSTSTASSSSPQDHNAGPKPSVDESHNRGVRRIDDAVIDASPAPAAGVVVHLGDFEGAVEVDVLHVGDVADPSDVEDHDRALHGEAPFGTLAAGGAPPVDGVAAPVHRASGCHVVGALTVGESVVERGLRRNRRHTVLRVHEIRPDERSANTWPADRMDAALRHERAHMRRKDLWTLLLAHVVCSAYWFHPMVWMVAARLRREQEQACDDAVILSGFAPASYAEALMAAAQTLTSTQLIGCPMLTQKTFRSRITRLLADGMPRVSSSSTLRRAAIVFAGAVITIGLLNGQAQSPDENGVYKVGNGIAAPSIASKMDPEYTPEAKDAKVEGTVLVQVVVGTDGLGHDINVIKGIGGGLDEKAVEAVQKWHFNPGMKEGQPVPVRASIEINFRLL